MSDIATLEELTPKQRKAVEALLTQGDVQAAADHAGCNRTTLYRWLKEPTFKAALREAEVTALDSLARELVTLAGVATATIKTVMTNPIAHAGLRLRAAEIVLSNLLKIRELVDIEARLSALEQSIGAKNE